MWVLKEGRDPAQASEAVSQGDAIENWAEREEIEDIKVGYLSDQAQVDGGRG